MNWANARYHRGGFEGKMSRREAALILGVAPSTTAKRIAESHKRVRPQLLQITKNVIQDHDILYYKDHLLSDLRCFNIYI